MSLVANVMDAYAFQLILFLYDTTKVAGDAKYVELALGFAYGADQDLSSVAGVQSLSGTGACRIGGHFLAKFVPKPEGLDKVPIYIVSTSSGVGCVDSKRKMIVHPNHVHVHLSSKA